MTRLAIWRPDSLEGQEIKLLLAGRRDLWDDLRLLSPDSDDALVSEIGDQAALVLPGSDDNLQDIDILFFCVDAENPVELPKALPTSTFAIVVAGDRPVHGMPSVVADINSNVLTDPEAPSAVASAHPGVVAMARLLEPLRSLALESCAASIILPSSTRGHEGIDQLLGQTRSILALQPPPPDEIFGHQLAFNIVPTSFSGRELAATLVEVLGPELEVTIQSSIGAVFHSLTIAAHVRLGAGVDEAALHDALAGSPTIEFAEAPGTLGPIDAAGTSVVQVGAIETSSAPGAFWLRAVMDNLTLGIAANAVGIADVAIAGRAAVENSTENSS